MTLTLDIPDEVYQILEQMAAETGRPVKQIALEWVLRYGEPQLPQLSEAERETAQERLRCFAGAESLGYPTGTDNESIDADLAREYGSNHEEEV